MQSHSLRGRNKLSKNQKRFKNGFFETETDFQCKTESNTETENRKQKLPPLPEAHGMHGRNTSI